MITLTFTARQVRNLLQESAADRLGGLLLKELLPADDISEFRNFIKVPQNDNLNYIRDALKARPLDKINLIKMLRSWAMGNQEFLAQFSDDDKRYGETLGLAALKAWVEKHWDELTE